MAGCDHEHHKRIGIVFLRIAPCYVFCLSFAKILASILQTDAKTGLQRHVFVDVSCLLLATRRRDTAGSRASFVSFIKNK